MSWADRCVAKGSRLLACGAHARKRASLRSARNRRRAGGKSYVRAAKERGDEAKRILDYGFKGFEARPLFNEGQIVGVAKTFGGASGRVQLIGKGPISVLVPKNSSERISAKIVYAGPIPAPVAIGQQVANLNVYRSDSLVLEAPLYASESVERGNLRQRAFDAAAELVIGLFRMGMGTKKI